MNELHCPHRPPCPGCPELGRVLAEGAAFASLRRFAEEHGLALEQGQAPEELGYRLRARLAVRGRAGSPKLGIFREGSHRVVDIPRCLVHHPSINTAAAALRQAMRELRVAPYADVPHRGLVRYAQMAVERASQRVQVVLVQNSVARAALEPLCARLAELLGPRLHSLFISPNTARGNAILGPRCEHVLGPPALREQLAGASVFFPPDAFGQANLDLYEHIVQRIGTLVPEHARILELYAGTGAIGLSLLSRAAHVTFNELGAGSLAGLRMGLEAVPPALAARADVLPGPAAAAAERVGHADVVIADPPRKGLDPVLLAALAATPPRRFIYLSCGQDSFVSDARALLESGSLRLARLVAYDLFPFTGHVETLACFECTSDQR